MSHDEKLAVQALQWSDSGLRVLDQRQLPGIIRYDEYRDAQGVHDAIASMRVRGAPAIGIAAAYGVVLSIRHHYAAGTDWRAAVEHDIALLAKSRPTAVNLFWALDKMRAALEHADRAPIDAMLAVAQQIHADDLAANRKMGELGAEVLGETRAVLTHCNTGALATGGYGTALGVVRSAFRRGLQHVYATETRPWMQGARLTLWELQQESFPATLIADSAAAYLMKTGAVDWVIVGADRITGNGDVANKIGTYALAVLARQHDVKFMVVAPLSTIDWDMADGNLIEIEQRDSRELLADCYLQPGSSVGAWNPVFDVTPAALIDAIVTERGVVLNPAKTGVWSLKP
jgi:methylthioribose-1-phosphate isomerase